MRQSDFRSLLDCLERLYVPTELSAYSGTALSSVKALFPDTVRALDFVDAKTGFTESTITEDISNRDHFQEGVREFVMQNPLVEYLAKGGKPGKSGVLDLADFVGRARLQQTELYEHVMAPLGIGRQLVLTLDVPGHIAGMTINRGWGVRFSEKERLFCEFLRPHLARARANCQAYGELLRDKRVDEKGWNPAHLAKLGLTRRQIDVLEWIAEGKRDAEIAKILGVSIRTVHSHVTNLLATLKVETRTAAVRAAQMP